MSHPLISVIMPAYNNAAYIKQAIQSALSQSLRPSEIIVVDDGSTDDTEAQVRTFGDRVRYLRQSNKGAGAARNHGIAASHSELIAFLDADDYWTHPDKLAHQANLLSENSEIGLSFHPARLVDASGNSLDRFIGNGMSKEMLEKRLSMNPPAYCLTKDLLLPLMEGCFIPLPAVVLRKEWHSRVGGFDEQLRRAQDRDLWFRLAAAGCRMAFSDAPWMDYRKYRTDAEEQMLSLRHVEARVMPQLKLLDNPDVHDERVLAATRRIAAWEFKRAGDYRLTLGDMKGARDYYARALRLWKTPGLFARWGVSQLGGKNLLRRFESPRYWQRLTQVAALEEDTAHA